MDPQWVPMVRTGLAALCGAFVGSFLNVCIDRIPEGRSLLWPPSHCQGCRAPIAAYDLLPVLNYLWLRGRCRSCGRRISPRMPLVELAAGAAFAAALVTWGFTLAGALAAGYICLAIVLFVIDLERHILPNVIVYPSLLASIALAPWLPARGYVEAAAGAIVGFGALLLIFLLPMGFITWLNEKIARAVAKLRGSRATEEAPVPAAGSTGVAAGDERSQIPVVHAGQESEDGAGTAFGGMGAGDVKLAAVIGALTGWPGVVAALYFSFIIGGGVAGLLVLLRVRRLKEYIPFGPALIVGGAVAALWGERAVRWYLGGRF